MLLTNKQTNRYENINYAVGEGNETVNGSLALNVTLSC